MAKTNQKSRKGIKPTASVQEAINLLKPMRGKDGIHGMFQKNDRGDYSEIGVYNYRTKQYALYRVEHIDSKSIEEFKEIMKGQ